MANESPYWVAVIGAGPAGLFAARQFADRNISTVLFNRDMKPGGLAEYGIYPTKTRMKEGLRNQFRQILALGEISYYGNVLVGEHADLSLADLREIGFQALMVTVGAQSAKHLNIPGEGLPRVYYAKDLVYHYNGLPPYSDRLFPIGKRVAVIGVGNVMMDITHWLLEDQGVDQVFAIARRGPSDVKFDRKEMESVIGSLDWAALEVEEARIRPTLESVQQTSVDFHARMLETAKKGVPAAYPGHFSLRFLSSPTRILGDAQGGVTGIELEQTTLTIGADGESHARGTGIYETLSVDTVIFAIGDIVDSAFGLPMQNGEFIKNPQPRYPVDGISYEAFDPNTGQVIANTFLAGWARRASTGLVGIARKDATNAAQAVLQYLETLPPTTEPVQTRLHARLAQLHHPVIDCNALQRLQTLERARAEELHVDTFHYGSNQKILEALGLMSSEPEAGD